MSKKVFFLIFFLVFSITFSYPFTCFSFLAMSRKLKEKKRGQLGLFIFLLFF